MFGGLLRYLTETEPKNFQPMNANFGLLDPPNRKMPKAQRKAWYAERALSTTREVLGC
jgi:methylenetetrahydrofolate--tRNA-(uracil-5-)-methyltransferase